MNIHDVIVVGAGPAGCQAAVSAAHQMRHVLVLDAGPVSQRKGGDGREAGPDRRRDLRINRLRESAEKRVSP